MSRAEASSARRQFVLGAVGLAGLGAFGSGLVWPRALQAAESAMKGVTVGDTAPELAGISAWFNSKPLTLAGLRGQVVLVDFWTHRCGNCLNTLPSLIAWHERHQARGLRIVGVHTPEFRSEADPAAVQAAITRWRIPYAVAMDAGYETWRAWGNRYWPALYLVDRSGRITYTHVGEGDYERTEREIVRLLG